MKKNIVSVALVALLIISTFSFAIPVFAEDEYPTLSLSEISCKKGESVEVFLNINNAAGLTGGTITVNFDTNFLKFVVSEQGPDINKSGLMLETDLNATDAGIGTAFLGMSPLSSTYKNINLIRIIFTAIKDGSSELELIVTDFEVNEQDITDKVSGLSSKVEIGNNVESKNIVDLSSTNPVTKVSDGADIGNKSSSATRSLITVISVIAGAVIAYFIWKYVNEKSKKDDGKRSKRIT